MLALSPGPARAFVLRFVAFLPARFEDKVEDLLDAFMSGVIAIRSPFVLLQAAVASFASWFVEGMMYWVIGEAFGLDVGLHVYFLVLSAANLALAILASPGGIGPFEFATQRVLEAFAVSKAAASAYAIALHVLLLAPVIAVGFALLWLSQQSLSELMGIPRARPLEPAPVPKEGA
jgi:uncharacterized membrane protein YbhN (UPF0104 family)